MNARTIVAAAVAVAMMAMTISLFAAEQAPAPKSEPIYGYRIMTDPERNEFRDKMRNAKSADERQVLRDEHRKQMETRAKERGMTLREPRAGGPGPRGEGRGPGYGMGPRGEGKVPGYGPGGGKGPGYGKGPRGEGKGYGKGPRGEGKGAGYGPGGGKGPGYGPGPRGDCPAGQDCPGPGAGRGPGPRP